MPGAKYSDEIRRPRVEVLPGEGPDLAQLVHILDTLFALPGTKFRFGLDPLLGLIPGVGDSIGALLSSYLLYRAAQEGFPVRTLVRMIGNIMLDGAVGMVPVLGDVFDFAFKANRRNLALMRRQQADPEWRPRPRSSPQIARLFFILAVSASVLVIAAAGLLLAGFVRLILSLV